MSVWYSSQHMTVLPQLWSFVILQLQQPGPDGTLSNREGPYAIPLSMMQWNTQLQHSQGWKGAKDFKRGRSWEEGAGRWELYSSVEMRKGAAKGLLPPLGGDVSQEALPERGVCFRLPLDIFFFWWKNVWTGSTHHYLGGGLFCLLHSKLLKMEIPKMKSIFQNLTPSLIEK